MFYYGLHTMTALDDRLQSYRKAAGVADSIANCTTDFGNKTRNKPAYQMEPFQPVVAVSLETMKTSNALPKQDFLK